MTLEDLVTRAFQIGLDHGHENERLDWDFCTDCVRFGHDKDGSGIGLLALLFGPANWGVKPPPVHASRDKRGGTNFYYPDPAGQDWKGVGRRSGKHWDAGTMAAPYGGLSIAHLDSGALRDIYLAWGFPGPESSFMRSERRPIAFDDLRRKGGNVWVMWLDWASKLHTGDLFDVEQGAAPAFACWVVRYWLGKFWRPYWEAAKPSGLVTHSAATWAEAAASAAVGARFANSYSGVAKKHAGKPADVIADEYERYYEDRRGKGARARRQANYAMRLKPVVGAAWIGAV